MEKMAKVVDRFLAFALLADDDISPKPGQRTFFVEIGAATPGVPGLGRKIEFGSGISRVLQVAPLAPGSVVKCGGGRELLKAIEETLHGRSYLTPRLRAEDWVAAKARVRQFSKELTERQRDFLQLFAEGHPLKEIAAVLNLSEKTVEFHKHHIMEAFNVKSNADLVLFALKRGLISVNLETHPIARIA